LINLLFAPGSVCCGYGATCGCRLSEQRLLGVTAFWPRRFCSTPRGATFVDLERQMRFITLSVIDIVSLFVSTAVGIGRALRGFGYWSLVATTTVTRLSIPSACG